MERRVKPSMIQEIEGAFDGDDDSLTRAFRPVRPNRALLATVFVSAVACGFMLFRWILTLGP